MWLVEHTSTLFSKLGYVTFKGPIVVREITVQGLEKEMAHIKCTYVLQ
jgi:hypothetical protein